MIDKFIMVHAELSEMKERVSRAVVNLIEPFYYAQHGSLMYDAARYEIMTDVKVPKSVYDSWIMLCVIKGMSEPHSVTYKNCKVVIDAKEW